MSAADTHSKTSAETAKNKRTKRGLGWLLFRGLRLSLLLLIVLIILVVLIVLYLAGTNSGFTRVTHLANQHVAGLQIDSAEGNLREGISAKSVTFANDAIEINALNLQSDWRLNCLLQRRYCLESLSIDELDIVTRPSEEAPPEKTAKETIELPLVSLPIDLDISDASIGTLRFQSSENEDSAIAINNIYLSASTGTSDADTNEETHQQADEGSAIDIKELSLEYLYYKAQAKGQITLQGDYPLDLYLDVTTEDALPDSMPEGVGLQPLSVRTHLSNSVAELDITSVTEGIVDVTVEGQVQALQAELPLSLNISSPLIGWPLETQWQVLASNTRIKAYGDMNDYTFSIDSNLSGENVPNTGVNIVGAANTQRARFTRMNIDSLNGNALGSALISLNPPMEWNTQWKLRDLNPVEYVADLNGQLEGTIKASGSLDDGKWSLNLEEASIDGMLREIPFEFDAKLQKELNDTWQIEQVTLANDRNQLQLQGSAGEQLDIDANIQLPQLQNLVPGLAGGFNSSIEVNGLSTSPDIIVNADANVLRFNDILIRNLALNGNIRELFINDSQLDLSVDTLRAGENTVSNSALSLNGTRLQHRLNAKANGPQQTAIDLQLSGSLDDALNWDGQLDRVQSTVPEHKIELANPAALNWQNAQSQLRVAPHCWNLPRQSTLCLNNEVTLADEGEAQLSLAGYSLQQLNSFLPEKTTMSGNLDTDAVIRWGNSGPTDRRAIIETNITDLGLRTVDALGDRVDLAYEKITLDANVTPTLASAALQLDSRTLGNAKLEAKFDPSNPDSDLEGNVSLEGLKVEIAKAFLPDFNEVDGTISASGSLQGTLKDPQYNGNIELDSPRLQSEVLPLPITGGKITARINGQSLRLTGQILSNEGQIDINGRGSLDPENWNAQVNLEGKNLNIQSDPLQESSINHSIRINANASRISVKGDIDVPLALIDVEELPKGARTVSSDVIIIEDEIEEEQTPQSAENTGGAALNTEIDLTVSLGDDVTVSAYGLNANLQGDMEVQVRGNKAPQLRGEINVVDGIFKKYGQDLAADGQILFVGQIESTRLAIDAVRDIDNEERFAGLRIQGTVEQPELSLFTEPEDKSQDAILSYIILGRDINQASDQEADLLATAMLALAVKGGTAVGSNVADALGIEEFGFETRGSGDDTELVVSGRLNDRLLLRYGRGAFDAESTLYLRYDLSKKLYLEAAQGAQQAVDLFYSFSF